MVVALFGIGSNPTFATPVSGWSTDQGGGTLTEPIAGAFLYSNPTAGGAHAATFSAVTLNVGDGLTFSGLYSNTVAGNGNQQIRFGMLDNTVGTASGNTGWAGYWIGNILNGSGAPMERSTTGNYWSTTGATALTPAVLPTGTSANALSLPVGQYSFTITYTRLNSTDLQLNWDIMAVADSSGNPVTGVYDFTGSVVDSSVTSFKFDEALVFSNGSGFTGTIGLFNLDVSPVPVPEPSTLGLAVLGGVLCLMLRRRHQVG